MLCVLDEQDDAPAAELVAAYQPGFLGKTVPDHSPLNGGGMDMPLDSPGMVSMEITQPMLAAAALPYGDGNDAPMEDEEQQLQEIQDGPGWAGGVPGEVTAGLPSFGALVEEDAYGEEELLPQQEQQEQEQQQGGGMDRWGTAAEVTMNITDGIPGLSCLIAEDEEADAAGQASMRAEEEEATAGMDLTMPAGQ